MSYEELFAIAGNRLEEMDGQMQMLEPSDFGGGLKGRTAYDETFRLYRKFSETGDMSCFEAVADRLAYVTGYRI